MSRQKPYPRLYVLFVFILFALDVSAGPLESGYQAFERGDFKTALKYWQPLAEQHNADAAFNMGLLYKNGLGVEKDPHHAVKWFKSAAYYGSADAAYNLGVMYISGESGFPSKKSAVYWWKQAAEQGHHESQYNYAVMLGYGSGVEKDESAAMDWLKLSAQQGDENAIKALVQTYQQGLFGQAKNAEKAAYWQKWLGK